MPAAENLVELAREGYLPTDIDTDRGVVLLARLAHADFREVWYGDTVATTDAASHRAVPFEAFVEQFSQRRDDQRLSLIAHTSRCGSTLLCNLLALRPTTMVLNEPDFVTSPARKTALAFGAAEAEGYAALTRALLNFSCHAAAAAGRDLVIKLTSWTTPVVATALGRREDTTWLFLWREPEKVVASNLATPPSWGRDTGEGRAARSLVGITEGPPSTVEFYARTWHRIVDGFLSDGGDLRWRALAYRDLADGKADALLAAERWFALDTTGELPAAFEQESRRYSKGSRAETFEPTRTHLRTPLEPDEVRRVDSLTGRSLAALRAETAHRLTARTASG